MQSVALATGAETKALPATETPVRATSLEPSLLKADVLSDAVPGIAYYPSGIVQKQSGKWFASIMLAPNYSYRNLSAANGGEFSKSQLNLYESGLISLSGSISIGYLFNERLSFRSGLSLVRMGQTINDVLVFDDPAVISAIRTVSPSGSIPFSSPAVNNSLGEISSSGPAPYITDNHKRELNYAIGIVPDNNLVFAGRGEGTGSLIQGLSYLQIPVELRYLLISGNTDLVLSSGLGVNFLAGNNVILRYQGDNVNIGHTRNISSFGLSGTVAVGLERKLGDNVKLLAEPRFSHFISPVNTTGDMLSRPYAFSFFMGISYGF
jgi:hypothetical protein